MMPLSESEQWLLDEICAYVSDVTRRYAALHNWGCSWGLNPPVSRSARVM